MKEHARFIYLIIVFLGIVPMLSVAQASRTETIPDWQKKVYKILMRDKSSTVLEDSIAMYSFNFRLKIVKSKENKIKVDQLLVSDSLLYKIFPTYKELYNIDYSSLLKTRKKLNLVIPILISNTSPTGKSKYERQSEQPLVSVESAMDIAQNSLTSIITKNEFEDILLLNPVVIKIVNIR
ncbi:hypothetical protein [Pedobacter punctiformis]|uniref:Uncharacterized protein n=1 Tax=Pedobacter punctiformis TaxID=3004097 RepID=A0ABT4LC96_9SPHI|nr:hypothetical protein [Pedobacter sp. HCMS5-2]MCZ4245542.1 hypothetical protein [Pedobacter sp. HCMS5-2]